MVYKDGNSSQSHGLRAVFGEMPAVWAWTISLLIHVIVLGGFCLLQFSQSNARASSGRTPTATVQKVRKLLSTEPITPKPLVRSRTQVGAASIVPLDTGAIFDRCGIEVDEQAAPDEPGAHADNADPGDEYLVPHTVEFFGSRAEERKICYLVDCSGSMQGMFDQVRDELKQSVQALDPDQYFYVIFFGGGIFESGEGTLVRATRRQKDAVAKFIDSVEPAGATNAAAALSRAMRITDSHGDYPTLIYLLTDGFDLTEAGTESLSGRIGDILMKFAPTTRISTIGFWPRQADRKILEEISRLTGGDFVSFGGGSGTGADTPVGPQKNDFMTDMVVEDE